MRSLPLVALVAIFTASTTAHASPVSINVTATTIGHQFSPSYAVDYLLGSDYSAAAIPSFTANLSQVDTFSLTVQAPAGYEFLLHQAPSASWMSLNFSSSWFASGGSGGVPSNFMPTTVSFTGYTGPSWNNDTTGIFTSQDGNSLSASGYLSWYGNGTSDIRFKSVTIAADLSSLNSLPFASGNFSSSYGAIEVMEGLTGARSDPGKFVSLVPASIPVPAAVWLFGSGLIGLLSFNRRKNQNI